MLSRADDRPNETGGDERIGEWIDQLNRDASHIEAGFLTLVDDAANARSNVARDVHEAALSVRRALEFAQDFHRSGPGSRHPLAGLYAGRQVYRHVRDGRRVLLSAILGAERRMYWLQRHR